MRRAREVLLPGWGLAVVKRTAEDGLSYLPIRRARPIRTGSKEAIAQLLWRDEALRALDSLGAANGVRSKPRHVLWERLCEVTELNELRTIVTTAITARQGWRDVQEPRVDDAKRPPSNGSSRFLARRLR
jgi:hypothetical protein